MVDKPITATIAEAEELGALAKSKNLVLYAFQNRRWDSDYLNLRRLLDLPESSPESIGTVLEFESVYAPLLLSVLRLCLDSQITSVLTAIVQD